MLGLLANKHVLITLPQSSLRNAANVSLLSTCLVFQELWRQRLEHLSFYQSACAFDCINEAAYVFSNLYQSRCSRETHASECGMYGTQSEVVALRLLKAFAKRQIVLSRTRIMSISDLLVQQQNLTFISQLNLLMLHERCNLPISNHGCAIIGAV